MIFNFTDLRSLTLAALDDWTDIVTQILLTPEQPPASGYHYRRFALAASPPVVLDLIDRTDKAEADAQHHEAAATDHLERLHRLALLADPWIHNDTAANAATYEQTITAALQRHLRRP